MAIKRSGKKSKKKLGSLKSSGSSSTEQSSRRPKWAAKTPPCQLNCPQGTDVRGILRTIADGEKHEKPRDETFLTAFTMLTKNNPFPSVCGRVCPHPCETGCNRNELDEPASINAMERFIGDWGLDQSLALPADELKFADKPIAVIGAGPAGLAAAFHLRKRGYPVTVNAEAETAFAADVAETVAAGGQVDRDRPPVLGAEDFSYMLNERPGAFIWIGNGDTAMVHHPEYDFNDEAIPYGVSYWAKLAETAMPAG